MSPRSFVRVLFGSILLLASLLPLHAAVSIDSIPRVQQAPKLEDFEGMAPRGAALGMQRIETFIQNIPFDGQPPTQRTEAYLGHDDINLYIVFLCFDTDPKGIRSHITRRENIFAPRIFPSVFS